MRTFLCAWTVLALLVLSAGGCTREFRDGSCYDSNRPPVGTDPYVALFYRDGRPMLRPARVQVSQSGRSTELVPHAQNAAEFRPPNRHVVYRAVPPDRPGNLYVFHPSRNILTEPCSAPLHYRVEAPGCVTAEADYSWNDNTYPERLNFNWNVTVLLDCTPDESDADGGVAADVPDA